MVLSRLVTGLCIATLSIAALAGPSAPVDLLQIVDCSVPGQMRQLGTRITYLAARSAVRTTAQDCQKRGGEYALGRSGTTGAALRIWLAAAQAGDAAAQNRVGEIYELGVNGVPDYTAAHYWYQQAIKQNHQQALVSLGNMLEQGLGVPADPDAALALYRLASGSLDGLVLDPSRQAPSDLTRVVQTGTTHLEPPTITILTPTITKITRGLVKMYVAPSSTTALVREPRRIEGRIAAPLGIMSATLNGRSIELNQYSVFSEELAAGESTARIAVVDNAGARASIDVLLSEPPDVSSKPPEKIKFGNYYALLVGNQRYAKLPNLVTPAADVDRIADVLRKRYGFEVKVLYDATRYDLLTALNQFRETLTSEDNLLVYYAGHGVLEPKNNRGHWLPVDADPSNTANWLSNVDITDVLNVMSVKKILLVVDSCYGGTLTRSSLAHLTTGKTEAERNEWLALLATKRSRVVLSSGGIAPVLDAGGGKHSVFAQAFIDTLETNQDRLLGRGVHQSVAARVAQTAAQLDFEQLPEFAPVSKAGHEAGDFIFVPKEN